MELLLRPPTELVVTSCHTKSTFCHVSQSDREMVHCCCVEYEKTTLQNDGLVFFPVISGGTHLSSFFTFPICLKCQVTVEWSKLSSWAASHVVVRGSVSVIALSWSLSTSNGHPLRSSSSRLSSPLQNFLNHGCTVCSLAVPRSNVLLMFRVV